MYILRTYQHSAVAAALDRLSEFPSTLLAMATGLGKTVVFAALAREWLDRQGGRVLIVAHRQELIWQAAEKLETTLDERVGVEMNRHRSEGGLAPPRVVVASIQTLASDRRIGAFRPADFSLLIIDEAHHAAARGYRKVVGHFRKLNPAVRAVGVTATPKRHDKLALKSVFESLACQYAIPDAIADGWLVNVVQKVVRVDGLDFSELRKVRGDFTESDLEEVLNKEGPLHAVAAATHAEAAGRPGIVFAVNVRHAHALGAVLGRYYGDGQVVALNGKSDPEERAGAVRDFKAGRVRLLVNCGLFLEGFDAPATSLIVMARPTMSLSLYEQMMGRGTRPLPGLVDGLPDDRAARLAAVAGSGKPDCLVLDFAGNAGKHKIITALDVLGGKMPDEVRDYAFRAIAEGTFDPMKVDQALAEAAAEMALLTEEGERLKRIKAAAVRYSADEVSPFGGRRSPAAPAAAKAPGTGGGPTDKMVSFLVKWCGFLPVRARMLSRKAAGSIIGAEMKKRGWGK